MTQLYSVSIRNKVYIYLRIMKALKTRTISANSFNFHSTKNTLNTIKITSSFQVKCYTVELRDLSEKQRSTTGRQICQQKFLYLIINYHTATTVTSEGSLSIKDAQFR